VLSALGLSGARLDSSETAGPLRMVMADPVVGGLPTHGWTTRLDVAPDGTVTAAYGRLSSLAKGDTYPVVSAAAAFKQLTAPSPADGGADHGIASCAAPAPQPEPTASSSDDKLMPHTLPCVAGNGHPEQVRGAVFGLAAYFVSGRQALVPAWLFQAAPAGVSRTLALPVVAVAPSYITPAQGGGEGQSDPGSAGSAAPASPAGPGQVNPGGPEVTGPAMPADPKAPRHEHVVTYRASGTKLTVSFYGGECDTYGAAASESASQVRVTVTGAPKPGVRICPDIALRLNRTITLSSPLGDRTVVDASDGRPVKGQ